MTKKRGASHYSPKYLKKHLSPKSKSPILKRAKKATNEASRAVTETKKKSPRSYKKARSLEMSAKRDELAVARMAKSMRTKKAAKSAAMSLQEAARELELRGGELIRMLSGGAASLSGGAAPLAGGQSAPLAGGESAPLAGGAAPLAGGEVTALAGGEVAPLAGGSAPLAGAEAAPLAGGETLAGGEAPLAGGEAPLEGGENLEGGKRHSPSKKLRKVVAARKKTKDAEYEVVRDVTMGKVVPGHGKKHRSYRSKMSMKSHSPRRSREPSAWNKFVKKNAKRFPGQKVSEYISVLSKEYKK